MNLKIIMLRKRCKSKKEYWLHLNQKEINFKSKKVYKFYDLIYIKF